MQKIKLTVSTLRWLSCKAFTSHTVVRGSIPGGNRTESFKEVVTAPMPSNRQQVRVARAFRYDGWAAWQAKKNVANSSLAIWVPTVGQHLKPITGIGDRRLHMSGKLSSGTQNHKLTETFSGSRFMLYYAVYSMHWPYSVISCLFSGFAHHIMLRSTCKLTDMIKL